MHKAFIINVQKKTGSTMSSMHNRKKNTTINTNKNGKFSKNKNRAKNALLNIRKTKTHIHTFHWNAGRNKYFV